MRCFPILAAVIALQMPGFAWSDLVSDGQNQTLSGENGCEVQFFGPAKWTPPKTKSEDWVVGAGISRWKCPVGGSMRFSVGSAGILEIRGPAQIMKFDDQIFVENGTAITRKGNELKPRVLYVGKATGWTRVKPQPAPGEVKNWAVVYPLANSEPQISAVESVPPAKAEPVISQTEPLKAKSGKVQQPPHSSQGAAGARVMVSAYFGQANILSEQTEFSSTGSLSKGFRGWINPKGEPHSNLLTMDFFATEKPEATASVGKSSVEGVLVGWGPRYKHSNTLGLYALVQTGVMYNKIEKAYAGYSVRRDRMHVPVGLSLGVQKLLLPDVFRLLVAVEFSVLHGTMYVDQIPSDDGAVPAGYRIRGSPLIYGINLHLGPAFQF